MWPPLLTVGDPAGDEGVSAGRLGTIQRDDGYNQVMYNGWPLYFFAPDDEPGDAKGQNSGDVWYELSTHGGPIQNSDLVTDTVDHELGTILTDASGRMVYLTSDDDSGDPTCTRGAPWRGRPS